MRRPSMRSRCGFSIIELVIVVAIIGVISAIAIPRISRSMEDAPDTAYAADLRIIEDAVDRYATEHLGKYPTQALFVHQLTRFTDIDGRVSSTKTRTHLYGPYMRAMPQIFITRNSGGNGGSLTDTLAADEFKITDPVSGKDFGWRFNAKTGRVRPTAAMKGLTVESVSIEPVGIEPVELKSSPAVTVD